MRTATTTVIVSKHAKKRIKERCGIRKSSADRVCRLATERGVERAGTKGPLRKWLDLKYSKQGEGSIYVWGDAAYLISKQNVVITVIPVPTEFRKNLKRMFVQPA